MMNALYERTNQKRMIALAVLVAILIFTLFSSCYVIMEADHDCTGADCPICALIVQCADYLRQFISVQSPIIAIITVIGCMFSTVCPVLSIASMETLITRKVRLNN